MTTPPIIPYEEAVARIFEQCTQRFKAGEAEYGRLTFLDQDLHREVEEELFDVINYAVMMLMKLHRMKEKYDLK